MKSWSINELIRRCRAGEKAAWEEFFRRFTNLITKKIVDTFVGSFRADLAADQDNVREVYLLVYNKLVDENALDRLRSPFALTSYLEEMARNKTLDWLIAQGRQKNLPRVKAEAATVSLEAPINPDGDLTAAGTVADVDERYPETNEETAEVLEEMAGLKGEELWALRLKVMFYNPFDEGEIKELAAYLNKSYTDLEAQLDGVIQRLLDTHAAKENDLGSAARVSSLIIDLEARLLEDLKAERVSAEEHRERAERIGRKRKRMEVLLKSARQLIEPSNKEIAAILGIAENKAQQVSVHVHRARAKLKEARKKKEDPAE
jgi:DNA-directed RNA polymerase specialized sigma24 family protein